MLFTSDYVEMAMAEAGAGTESRFDLLGKPFRLDGLTRRLRRALSNAAA